MRDAAFGSLGHLSSQTDEEGLLLRLPVRDSLARKGVREYLGKLGIFINRGGAKGLVRHLIGERWVETALSLFRSYGPMRAAGSDQLDICQLTTLKVGK